MRSTAVGRRALLGVVLVAVLAAVTYAPVVRCGFIWDDDEYVTQNPLLESANGLATLWTSPRVLPQYYPLTFTTFWVEHQLWGLNPAGYHVVNVLLHAANAALLGLLLSRLAVRGAWVAAAVFAVHPVTVESVAWITERKNVLSLLFYLLAAMAYFRHADAVAARHQEPPLGPPASRGNDESRRRAGRQATPATASPWGAYALSLALFACSLLSKSVTASLPAAILLVLWWKRGRLRMRDIVPLAPLFVLGAAMGLHTAWLERHHVGAEGQDWSLTFLERCLVAGRAVWFYAAKLAWPHPLVFIYPRWTIDAHQAWQFLYPAAAAVVVGLLWWFRGRLGRGPLVAVLLFVGTLGPALGFVSVYPMRFSFVADHFQYHASMALIALAVVAADAAIRRLRDARSAAATLSVATLVVLAAISWRALAKYESLETLWTDTLAKNPQAWIAHNNIGNVLIAKGKYEEAIPHFKEVFRLRPDHAEAYNNLGNAYAWLGRVDEAIAEYAEALRLQPRFPGAQVNYGIALMRRGQHAEALSHFEEALRLNPNDAAAHDGLGRALDALGRTTEALPHFHEAIRLDPRRAEAHLNLANALQRLGRSEEAATEHAAALRLKPALGGAHVGQGVALLRMGRADQAVKEFEQALAMDASHARAHAGIAHAYQALGKMDDAVRHLREVARLEPQVAEGHYSLAFALDRAGKVDEALPEYERALQLKPGWTDAQVSHGVALARSGRSEQAVGELSQAVAARPADAVAQVALGGTLDAMGRTREAIPHLREAVRLAPEMPEAQFNLGHVLEKAGQFAEAAERYGSAVKLRPDWAAALQAQAWVLATSPDAAVRDGARALTLAQRACELTGRQDASALEALAAAQAETGHHADAASTARSALALVQGSSDAARRQDVEARLALYESRRPYRQPASARSGR